MSDAGESGDPKESFVEDENKVKIEATFVSLGCVKNEPNEETLDFEGCQAKQYRITLECENIFGEPSHQRKIEEDHDNLIGFRDNDIIMENAMIKLEPIKEEDEGGFNNFYCSKCKGIYKGYCLKCSTLSHILNNNSPFISSESESNTIPTDILEIRETSMGKGVYLLRALPMNIIFGPFEGILGIQSTVGHSWRIIDNKLRNIKSGNWMKNIDCAASALLKNMDIFQIDGNLYFQTNREITEGEELLIYYDDEELQQLNNSKECLYTPHKQEKLPKIFACTVCCLGFGSNECLIEHKRKCCQMEHSRRKDFVLIECYYCKMWMEKWEHEEYHVAYCLEKYHRMWNVYSEVVYRSDTNVEEVGDDCDTKNDKKAYQQIQNEIEINNKRHFQKNLNNHRGKSFKCDICMLNYSKKSNLKVHIKNKHADDGSPKDYNCPQCPYKTNYKNHFQRHLNTHKGIKPFNCDICMKKFGQKLQLKAHLRNKHADDGSVKDYKCSECTFQTNNKNYFQIHLNNHRGIRSFKCDICMKTFLQKPRLKEHIRNKHTNKGSEKLQIYKCAECSWQTNYRSSLRRHLIMHRGIKPFTCDICMMKFTQKSNLKMHTQKKHTNDRSTRCLECFYQTNCKASVQLQLNKQIGIKPFNCDICMKEIGEEEEEELKTQIRNTAGESAKDYKCSECSYQTNYKNNFQRHLNKHKGIKPFKCDICMAKFGEKMQLKTHIRNNHTDDGNVKDYKCLECSFQTNYKSNFQRHLNAHSGIKPFTCDICMAKFTQKGNLNTHVKEKHTNDRSAKD